MKRRHLLIATVILGFVLTLSFQILTSAQTPSDSQPEGGIADQSQNTTPLGSDSNPTDSPEVSIPEQYQPDDGNDANAVTDIAATLYFTPQDENTSTTVLFLYNTGTVSATVGLETYQNDGTPFINTSVEVPAGGLVRICADTVSTIASSWSEAVLVNFTTFSTYAKMTLPAGVKAEAYVAWNGGSTYDPLAAVPTLPIRFSIDPPTVFLPTVVH